MSRNPVFNSQTRNPAAPPGIIMETNNGGTTWTLVTSGTTDSLESLYFINPNKGYICGSGGTLLTNCVQSPDSIKGPSTVCQGDTGKIYSVTPVAGATGYHWSVPPGMLITSGNNTNSITVTCTASSVSGIFSVYAYNTGCSSASSPAFSVIVNPVPETPVITSEGYILVSNAPDGNQWYFNGTTITGATGQDYNTNLTGTGYYWTVVTIDGCSSDTSNHELITSGVDSPLSSAISVYPVPNDGRFTVSLTIGSIESFSINIYNCLGMKIYEETNVEVDHSLQKMIDLRPLPDGIYTVIFSNDQNQVVEKIVVN
jgi:hypothetical protein